MFVSGVRARLSYWRSLLRTRRSRHEADPVRCNDARFVIVDRCRFGGRSAHDVWTNDRQVCFAAGRTRGPGYGDGRSPGAHADVVGQTDPVTSKSEVDGLRSIVKHLRAASGELSAAASEMRAAASWQDTKHDVAKMRADAKITEARDHKIKALNEAAAELQKEIDFWKSIPVARAK